MALPTSSLHLRLFAAFAVVTGLAALLPVLFARGTLYQERLDLAKQQVLSQAAFIGSLLEDHPVPASVDSIFASAKELSLRLTLIDPDGRVIRDTDADLPALDNHGDRPEIQKAEQMGVGVVRRRGSSLGYEAIYAASRLADGSVVRVAAPVAEIERHVATQLSLLGLAIAGAILLCLFLSWLIVRRVRTGIRDMTDVVRSMSPLNPGRRLRTVPGREFLPLAAAVNRMADNAEKALRTVADQSGQLETILDSMEEGLLVLDAEGRIRRTNRALEGMFPGAGEAIGKTLIEAVPLPTVHLEAEALLRGKPITDNALEYQCPSGRFLLIRLSPPAVPNQTLGAVAVFYDATNLMRLERIRRDFVANVSHELRTPLTTIAGCAELLRDCPNLPPEYVKFAAMIQRNAAMLSRVVGDLLELARIENSNEPVTREPVNPRLSLHEALETCGALAAEKEIRFRIDMPETAMVTANEHLLGQVFRNLLENACRYAPQGSEVGIAGERHDTEMVFTVSDHGPGIPQASLGRIFERFYQVEKERNSATAGLGLAISKHIVERLHGRIWAESPYNDASTALRFTLPLVQNPAHPHDGPQGDTALADHSEQPKDQGAA